MGNINKLRIVHRLADSRTYNSLLDMPVDINAQAIGVAVELLRKYQQKKMAG